jgi:hypothetical protein
MAMRYGRGPETVSAERKIAGMMSFSVVSMLAEQPLIFRTYLLCVSRHIDLDIHTQAHIVTYPR